MRQVVIALFVCCLIASSFASCHHDCSDNGDCVEDECQCFDNWVGDDCSVPYLPLSDGDTVTGHVSGDWVYYYTDVDSSSMPVLSLTYSLTDDLVGDCDLYLRRDHFPSKHHNDYSDSGWDNLSSIVVEFPDDGRWILGIYNFISCDYTLTLTIQTGGVCPNDCSGHGTCGIDNQCICDNLWGGEDCSEPFIALVDGEIRSDHVEHYEWTWYYYDVAVEDGVNVDNLQIVVNQTTSGDSDLYVKFGEIPTLWSFDYRNAAILDNYALQIGNPREGRYFIGIYGYSTCDYNIHIVVTQSGSCDNPCSNHGYCSQDACVCVGPFEGNNCEYMTTDLAEGQSVSGFAAANQWNYYTVTANSASNMVIAIDQDWNTGGDCDLYVRANEYPDRFHFDFRDISFDESFNVVVQNPLATHWFIGVYGYHSCQYFITETLEAVTCPNDCSGHGNCVNGRCACSSGFAGQDCASPLERIHSKDYIQGTVGQNRWHYYKYTAPSVHTSVTVELIETSTIGYLELYVLEGAPPELTGAQYSDQELSALHNVYFQFDGTEDVDHDFYIGVYGTTLVSINNPAEYSIFVYSPPI